jgi:hypothetical protein
MANIERVDACQTTTGTICQDREQIVAGRREQERSLGRLLPGYVERSRQVLKRYAIPMAPALEGGAKLTRHENPQLGMATDLSNEVVP